MGGGGEALGLWDENPIKLDCDDHCTTINIINSLSDKKKKELENTGIWKPWDEVETSQSGRAPVNSEQTPAPSPGSPILAVCMRQVSTVLCSVLRLLGQFLPVV